MMSSYKPFLDFVRLRRELNEEYGIFVAAVNMISDYCASVYVLTTIDKKYVFKLYRTFDTEIAMQSAGIVEYLSDQSFPVAPIVHTKDGQSTFTMLFPDGNRTAILYDFIDGQIGYELNFDSYGEKIGELMGQMHSLMETYDKPLIQRGRGHYIGRYINIMKDLNYLPSRINELDDYGSILWEDIIKTKTGFCHGDLNASNFILADDGRYYIFDFDCAGYSYSVNDIFTICNMTETIFDFNIASMVNYLDSTKKLSLIKRGYEKYRKLGEIDVTAMYSFIAISCYWSAAQHDKYKSLLEGGRMWMDGQYFDNRYNWLRQWRKMSRASQTFT